MSDMDTFAMWIGYATMVTGGLALVSLSITLVGDSLWHLLKRSYSLAQIMRVMQKHGKQGARDE